MSYAQNTSVSVEKSKAEIEGLLMRYGADQFVSGWEHGKAMIGFRFNNKMIRFILNLPDRKDPKFWKTPGGRRLRHETDAFKAWEQGCRQKWRALGLVVKAKLEAVEAAITTFEHEFMAHIVLPNGDTVGDHLLPKIEKACEDGEMPKLLLLGSGRA